MPRISEHQWIEKILVEAFVIDSLAREEDFLMHVDTDSSDSSSPDSSDSANDSDLSSKSDQMSDSSGWSTESEDLLLDHVIESLEVLYGKHYMEERRDIPKTPVNLSLLLSDWKDSFPDIFRSYTGLTPQCFDDLLHIIQDHPSFHNDSNNPQMDVDHQLAIALYHFRHYGNAASTMKVALWAGVGYGTVRNVTMRVMRACCDERFRMASMPWCNAEEIERAKAWVEACSCPAWRDGWLMVDGTLVPIYQRPHYFGNAYFDRKSNYSLNLQVCAPTILFINIEPAFMLQIISTPDLHIVDYALGLPGSQHDATAWKETWFPHEHHWLLQGNDFVWADSAYPVRSWCQAPYKE